MYTLVLGGYRSGRSNYALRRASELGHPPWLYLSNEVETDEAVRRRLERQRRDAEAIWLTAPLPEARLGQLLDNHPVDRYGAIVLDGLSDWLERRMATLPESADRDILSDLEALADRLYRCPIPAVVISTEMGLGLRPTTPRDLRLLKVTTGANQILAHQASSLVFMMSGIPLRVR